MKSMFLKFTEIFAQPIVAVDLGTANTRICRVGFGKIIEKSSSTQLIQYTTNQIVDDYCKYINGKIVTRPLRGGVIVDLDKAIALLRPLIRKSKVFLKNPIVLACAPTDTSESERGLLSRALVNAGASRVSIIPELLAAAVGSGIDIDRPSAQLLIDIGHGVTDLAVFRKGRIVFVSAIRVACSDFQRAIRSAIMSKHRVQLYDHEAERLTHEISSFTSENGNCPGLIHVVGMDIVKRREVSIAVNRQDVIDAISPLIDRITRMIDNSFRKIPGDIYSEISEAGICLTGGGACIKGIDRLIASRVKMDVRLGPDPIHAVINGAIRTLDCWTGGDIVWPKLLSGYH